MKGQTGCWIYSVRDDRRLTGSQWFLNHIWWKINGLTEILEDGTTIERTLSVVSSFDTAMMVRVHYIFRLAFTLPEVNNKIHHAMCTTMIE